LVAHAGTIATVSVMIDAVNKVFRMMLSPPGCDRLS
jgi:hypothetical protein